MGLDLPALDARRLLLRHVARTWPRLRGGLLALLLHGHARDPRVRRRHPSGSRTSAGRPELEALGATDAPGVVEDGDPSVGAQLLHSLARSLMGVTVDLTQYSESYYFWERRNSLSLPANLPVVLSLVDASGRSAHPEVRHAGAVLARAADRLAERLGDHVDGRPDGASTEDTFAAYARDHCHGPGERD